MVKQKDNFYWTVGLLSQLVTLHVAGNTRSQIAIIIGVNTSTITREIRFLVAHGILTKRCKNKHISSYVRAKGASLRAYLKLRENAPRMFRSRAHMLRTIPDLLLSVAGHKQCKVEAIYVHFAKHFGSEGSVDRALTDLVTGGVVLRKNGTITLLSQTTKALETITLTVNGKEVKIVEKVRGDQVIDITI